jgi:hypothetical protein
MPKIRRTGLPPALFRHLADRVRERAITAEQLVLFLQWVESNPEVPVGRWFKRFPAMTVCGEGELIKTLLRLGQLPEGEEVT